jgi:hypothetical protein
VIFFKNEALVCAVVEQIQSPIKREAAAAGTATSTVQTATAQLNS